MATTTDPRDEMPRWAQRRTGAARPERTTTSGIYGLRCGEMADAIRRDAVHGTAAVARWADYIFDAEATRPADQVGAQ